MPTKKLRHVCKKCKMKRTEDRMKLIYESISYSRRRTYKIWECIKCPNHPGA